MKEKIYCIPGLMCDERLWSRIEPLLNHIYEIVHIKIPLVSDFDEIVDSIHDIIEDETINLFGFSFGAYISSYFAVKYPHRVTKLFLNAGTPSKMTQEEIIKRNMMIEKMDSFGFRGISSKKIISLLEKSNHQDKELVQIIQDMYTDSGKEVYLSQMKTINNRIALEEQLINLNIPITFFYSTEDRLLNYKSLEKFTNNHTHITKISRVGTSHTIPLEMPKKLSYEILKWMEN